MNLNDKIYIAGHRGLVGSAIVRQLKSEGFDNLLMRIHKELDLINQVEVQSFFQKEKPDYVVLAAAKVGGIYANNTYPADFIYQNMMIESNVINSAYKNQTKRLLFLGSTCVYPREANQPMREDALLKGALEPTNEPYAIAKIAGIKLCESYNRQYGTDFRSVMPTNLYGQEDNFHLQDSHVIPAVMRKIHLAKLLEQNDWSAIRADIQKNPIKGISKKSSNKEIVDILSKYGINVTFNAQHAVFSVSVNIWGSGNVMREFLHVDDMAEASLFVLRLDKQIYKNNTDSMLSHINVGTGKEVTIRKMAKLVKDLIGYKGELLFDTAELDGAPRKLVDVSRLSSLGWEYNTDLLEGLKKTYKWYLK